MAWMADFLNPIGMLSLIFGGCCSNVFALEALIKEAPGSGSLITAFQFLLTSLLTLPKHLDFSGRYPRLKRRAIPLATWLRYTMFFVAINLLNNKAFDYRISVPLHIILRSAGPVATMTVGYLSGKRYRSTQVVAVALLFIGVVQAALADAQAKGASISLMSDTSEDDSPATFQAVGFLLLFLALMLSAIMGVYTDRTYARYGRNHYMENLFYSHTLSLPVFLMYWTDMKAQFFQFVDSPPILSVLPEYTKSDPITYIATKIPMQIIFLVINSLTQYLCIRGVNLLSAKSSSLTVTIVLNIRKLVSLLLSIWLFGNRLAPGVLFGAGLVFVGGGLYSLPSGRPQKRAKPQSHGADVQANGRVAKKQQ